MTVDDSPQSDSRRSPRTITPFEETENAGGRGALIGIGGCLAIPIAVLCIGVFLGLTSVNQILNSVLGIFSPHSDVASVISTQTIVTSIQPLGQLVTISAQIARADVGVRISSGLANACGVSANHVVQGTIEAGVDLVNVGEANFSYDILTDTYTVTLPSPQLTSCRIDYIRQYDRSSTLCGRDWDEVRLLANHVSIVDFAQEAIEGGLLERAERETQLLMTNFISALTGSNVTIEFAEDAIPLPSSCNPDPPRGWEYDEEEGVWRIP